MALHEMWEISILPMGSLPYEEYFPCEVEMALLEKQELALFETYRELMYHFYIYLDVHGGHKGSSNSLKELGGLSVSHSRESSRRSSIRGGGGGHPSNDEGARPRRRHLGRR